MARATASARRAAGTAALAAAVALAVAGCSSAGSGAEPTPGATSSSMRLPAPVTPRPARPTASQADPAKYTVPDPGPLDRGLVAADMLVTSQEPLPDRLVARVRETAGVREVLPMSWASVPVDGRILAIVAADPAEFRRFTPPRAARAEEVWRRVAAGDVAVAQIVPRTLIGETNLMSVGTADGSPTVQVGAYTPLVRHIEAVVNPRRGKTIGLSSRNALLLSTGDTRTVAKRVRQVLGSTASLDVLDPDYPEPEPSENLQNAVLTAGTVAEAVGSFSYVEGPNGTIVPDRAWVAEYIRTERVPLLGAVTCNKAVLPQLRAALEEVVRSGLSSSIHPDEYAGCYYPRYIGRNRGNGLSLHSWGIALDLNVPGNQRGTAGEMDRRVVMIFEKWGFAWGGYWNYTDPMHFEMNAVVRPG
jgi:hypothetical protein